MIPLLVWSFVGLCGVAALAALLDLAWMRQVFLWARSMDAPAITEKKPQRDGLNQVEAVTGDGLDVVEHVATPAARGPAPELPGRLA